MPADGSPAWLAPDVPDVLRDKNGKFVIFMRDVAHRVWRAEQQPDGTFRWIFNGDYTEGDSPPEGIRNTDIRASLQVFMNVGGAVFTAYQFPELSDCSVGRLCGPPGYWGSFAAILSRPDDGNFWDIFGSPFPIIDKNGKGELFVTACNRYIPAQGCTLWVNRKITPGSGWWDTTGWVKIGGNFISDPDGALWSRRETSPAIVTSAGGWAAWEYLGGSLRDF